MFNKFEPLDFCYHQFLSLLLFPCTLTHFIFSQSFLFCVLFLSSSVRMKPEVIYFPYCVCAPLQQNIFDRIRGKFTFFSFTLQSVSMTSRSGKNVVCTVKRSWKKFLLIFICSLFFVCPMNTSIVGYFLWESEQFKLTTTHRNNAAGHGQFLQKL